MNLQIGNKSKNTLLFFLQSDDIKAQLDAKNIKQKFSGEACEIAYFVDQEDCVTMLLGLGKKESITKKVVKTALSKAVRSLKKEKISDININISECAGLSESEFLNAVIEGVKYGDYSFNKYKTTEDEPFEIDTIYLNTNVTDAEKILTRANGLFEGINFTKDLVNEPANTIYPETLANEAEKLRDLGVKVTIYDKKQIEDMDMKAFLSVSMGSEKEPRLIVLEYNNSEDEKPLALVGKGLTYDSGGYSIKPSDGMKTMKSDMGGAGTVLGLFKAVATNKVECNIVGVIAACENLISGRAYKPGDIVGSMSGKTIEVDNTDAEGRVTLADAVYYAAKTFEPRGLIDMATLTGACVIALGEFYTGAITRNQEFLDALLQSAKEEDENLWQMPVDDDIKKLNNSEIADIKNSGGRLAGMISAGLFVGEFVPEEIPWIHLDIAGTAFIDTARNYYDKGATGQMVKTLYNLVNKY
ncbi:MAG: leucyl aminopeptidase [Tissierellia bacterium]|nr:leucyl aminopeptidase [Tissierellia bacterium]